MAALTDIFSTPLVSGNRRGDAPLQPTSYVKDASGHEHKGKGPGGGQFTSQGGGEGGSSEPTSEPVPTKVVTKNLVQWGASQLGIPEKRLDELITSRTRPGVSRGLAFDMILKEGGVVLPTRAPSKSPKAKAKSPPKPESTAQETERALSQEPPTNVKRIYSPTSVVQLLTFPNGLEGVFKPASGELQEVRTEIPQGTMWRREVASYGVSKALGMDHLVPVTTFRNSSDLGPGSIQEFVPDTIPASSTANRFGNSQEDLAKAAIFDFIIGNRDRHADNWLLNNDGSLVLIDNGASFPDWIGEGEYGFTDLYDAAFEKGLTIPSINPEAWPQIEESLTTSGIEPTAIFLAKERFDLATQTSGNKFDKSFRDKVWKLESDLQDELRRRNRGSAQVQDSYGRPLSYAKAPKGGVTVQGQFYPGGQFIPSEVLVSKGGEGSGASDVQDSERRPVKRVDQESFKTPDADTTERVRDLAARNLAATWQVSPEDLAELAREDHATYSTKEDAAWEFLRSWASSSGGPIPTAAATAVCDSLGLPYKFHSESQAKINDYIRKRPGLNRATASFGKAMYDATQKWLAERGITEVELVRGGANPDETGQPASSWSTSMAGARGGDRGIYREKVPAWRILSVPPTGFGTLHESEVVVLPKPAQTLPVQDQYGRPLAYAKAPKGGVTVQGTFYPGGQFIPAEVLVNATEEERRAVESGESRGKPLPPFGGVREPSRGKPSALNNPQTAQKEFLRILKSKYPIAVPMFHEAPIAALDSIIKNGLTSGESVEDTNFATIGQPSGFVSSADKLIVKFSVRSRPQELAKIVPDMRYDPSNPAADLLTEHNDAVGADVAYNGPILPGEIDSIYVVKGGQVVDEIKPHMIKR